MLKPSRYKGLHGGRGSSKSHFFAALVVEYCVLNPAARIMCLREVQNSLKDSAKLLIEDKIDLHFPNAGFIVQADSIKTPNGGLIVFKGLRDTSASSIKSLEGFDVAWVEEAQTLSSASLRILRPTIRKEGSELWFSWNPDNENDPIDKLLRGEHIPDDAIVIQINYPDNPWFPNVLDEERKFDQIAQPEQYGHVWLGEYRTINDGAYFAAQIIKAKEEGRISKVSLDPLMTIRAFWDIGGTGAKADAVAIWIAQFIGKEIRILKYYEAQGQDLAFHINWLKANKYENALCVLPHDGSTNDKVFDVSYESALKQAGFKTVVVPNQGKGAAMARVEAARRLFPSMWFDEEACKDGLKAISWYHENIDEKRGIGLGPKHDWSSHGADAFGLMAVAHTRMVKKISPRRHYRTVSMP